jgi:hypothetical protein
VDIKRFLQVGHRLWDRTGDWLLAAGCTLLALVLYLQTLAPSVATIFDDSLEFPLASYRLAIAHPTGYPLYTLLGKLFTLGPWHNVAWAVNLLSAVAAALTVALVYLVARHLARRCLPALLGALALAASPIFWSQSVVAEVYTLNSAFVALLLWLALRWARRPLAPVSPFSALQVQPRRQEVLFLPGEGLWSRVPPVLRQIVDHARDIYRRAFPVVPPKRRLQLSPLVYALAAIFGLSLTHHRTVLLLAPALFVFALLVERRALSRAALLGPERPKRPRWLQIAGRPVVVLFLCALVPLLLYLYLPIRGGTGSLDGTYENTWRGFWQWVMASGYNVFLGDNPLARDLDAAFYASLFVQQFGPVGLALAILGVLGLTRRSQEQPRGHRFRGLVLTGLAFAAYAAFAILYRVPDVEVFLIPAFLLVAVWIAVGLDYAFDLLRPRGSSMALRRLLAVCSSLLLLAGVLQPLLIAALSYPDLDLSRRWGVHDFGVYLLGEPLPSSSTIVGIQGEMTLLRYFQETTGRGTSVETVTADREAERRAAVDAALARGRDVYITRPLPGLTEDYGLDAVLGLVDLPGARVTLMRVGKPDGTMPDLPRSTDLELLPGLQLLGYGVREHRGHWQAWARLRLWWRAPEGQAEPFKISARLVDARGVMVAATDAAPVSGAYPTAAWRPGEVVADAYEIPLPAGLPPGEYRPLVIVYEPDTGVERGRAELAPVNLQGNPSRPPRRALEASVGQTSYASFGDLELLGFTPSAREAPYQPGDALPLTLLWQARGRPAGDLRVAFWLEGEGEYALGEFPIGQDYPVSQWDDNQVVRQWPALQVPGNTLRGTYRLKMRVTRDGQPAPWGRWLFPLGSDLSLGEVQVGR